MSQLCGGLESGLHPSATLAIHERVAELRRAGRDVIHLGFGESRFSVHPHLVDALCRHAGRSGYLPVLGLPELRQAVAEFRCREFGTACSAEQIVIGPGSKLLLYSALLALEGDLLLPAPSWVSYAPQAQLAGKRVHWIPTRPIDGYLLQPTDLADTIARAREAGGEPKLLLLNSPNNPTGAVYPPQLLAELAEIVARERLLVLSDEIYALVTRDGSVPASMSGLLPESTLVFSGVSKDLSLGGWRLGYLQLPTGPAGELLVSRLRTIASETWSAVAAPIQYAALTAFADDPDIAVYRRQCTQAHGVLIRELWNHVRKAGLDCPQPAGAFYIFPSFAPFRKELSRQGVSTSVQLAEFLLETAGLATLPGSAFGMPNDDLSLRLSTGCVLADDAEAAVFLAELAEAPHDPSAALNRIAALQHAGERFAQVTARL
jgi:aspartate aminotransferase